MPAADWPRQILAGSVGTLGTLAVPLTLGLLAFAPLGPQAASVGIPAALATSVIGGTVYALAGRASMPSAGPSSATALILASLVLQLAQQPDITAATVVALAGLTVLCSGLLQMAMALLGLARLARFVPQPVLAGFMNGVALLIVLGQVPLLLGHGSGQALTTTLAAWQPAALLLGAGTALLTWSIARRWPGAPAALMALLLGTAVYHLLPLLAPGVHAGLALGALPNGLPGPDALRPLLSSAGLDLLRPHAATVAASALALALVGALESALNTLAIDQARGTRHDPRRELLAVGLANLMLGAFGGLPAVALRARATAMLQAGGQGMPAAVSGSLVLGLLVLAGGHWLAWLPLPVLAGIMCTVALGLLDRWTHGLLAQWWAGERSRPLLLSLAMVAVVCGITVWQGFVVAVGVGVLLSMLVFIASMNRSLVRSRASAATRPSRRIYPEAIEAQLQPLRGQVLVLELEGALFFGSGDRLLADTELQDTPCHSLVLDLQRVGSIDETGALALQQLQSRLRARGTALLLAGIAPDSARGRALQGFGNGPALWPDVDRAVEAAEQALLGHGGLVAMAPVALADSALLQGLDDDGRAQLLACMQTQQLQAGETLFAEGDVADCLYVLGAGSVSVVSAPRPGVAQHRYLSLSPGMMFGETAMLDGRGRSAAVVADTEAVVHRLLRADLERAGRSSSRAWPRSCTATSHCTCRSGCAAPRRPGTRARAERPAPVRRSGRVALLQIVQQRAQRLRLAADRPARPRRVVPGEQVDVQPGQVGGHEVLQEQRGVDRTGQRAAAGVDDVGDVALDAGVVVAPERQVPQRVVQRQAAVDQLRAPAPCRGRTAPAAARPAPRARRRSAWPCRSSGRVCASAP